MQMCNNILNLGFVISDSYYSISRVFVIKILLIHTKTAYIASGASSHYSTSFFSEMISGNEAVVVD